MPTAQTRERILDATMHVMADRGLAGLSLEDVAQAADVSRQTVYRHFGNRDQLVSAAILREEEAFIEQIVEATRDLADLEEALAASIRVVLTAARDHPLLDRLLATEPEALLPFMTTGRGPVLPAARPVLAGVLRGRLPDVDPTFLDGLADMCTRLVISYTVNPSEVPVDRLASTLAGLIVRGVDGIAAMRTT